MKWLDLVENPQAISSIYNHAPSLEQLEIMSVKLDREGPTVELTLALREFPTPSPKRWPLEANAVTVHLQLMGVQSLEILGWSTTNTAAVELERTDAGAIRVKAVGSTTKLVATCGFVRISQIAPYRKATTATRAEVNG